MHAPRSLLLVAVAALLAVDAYSPGKVKSTSPKSQPGFCTKPEDCKVANYECVALQTTRAGAEDVKQCVPKKQDTDVCSGQFPGLCPTFSAWTEPYKLISSVCTYKPAKKCAKDPTGESVKGEVVCVPGAKDNDDNPLSVIYGCVDVDINARKLGFTDAEDAGKLAKTLDTAATVIEACLDTNATKAATLLCGGHGTCLPKNSGSLKYECRCNVGYSGDFCDVQDSNKCALPGQCSAGICNLETQSCECPAGTTGNQCADCDASSSDACSGSGVCTNKKCICNEGFLGDHCDQKVKPKVNTTKSTSTSKTSGSSSGNGTTVGTAEGNGAAPGHGSIAVTLAAFVVATAVAMN